MTAALEAQGIDVFRGGRGILKGVSLRVMPGEFTAIVGPNGSGKSTLLRALAGLWPVAAGAVNYETQPIHRMARRAVAQRIAFVPQETRIDFAFTVEEIVSMGRHPHRGRFSPETATDRDAVQVALDRCDVSYLRHRSANTLSGGERQRVLIARSLAAQPDVILLDEPTASLDIEHALDILELCRALARDGRGVALATHDLNAVARYADSVALMDHGELLSFGSAGEVLSPAAFQKVFGVRVEMLTSSDGSPHFAFRKLTQI